MNVVVESEHREPGGKMFCVPDKLKRKRDGRPLGKCITVLPSWPEILCVARFGNKQAKNMKIEKLKKYLTFV